MIPEQLEKIYERLAIALDSLEEEQRSGFLARLALLLAQELGNAERVLCAVEEALAT